MPARGGLIMRARRSLLPAPRPGAQPLLGEDGRERLLNGSDEGPVVAEVGRQEGWRTRIRRRGAESCYWDYAPSFGNGPFRNVICLSVNDAVLHGLPRDYGLRDGDVLSMDLAVAIDGWVADAARTVVVGTPDDADLRIVRATEEALEAGIRAARPGNRLGDISAAIGGAGRGMRLQPGLTIALEPWLARTTDRIVYDPDGWTIRSADGSRTAHSEHTLAITDDGPLVLTRPA